MRRATGGAFSLLSGMGFLTQGIGQCISIERGPARFAGARQVQVAAASGRRLVGKARLEATSPVLPGRGCSSGTMVHGWAVAIRCPALRGTTAGQRHYYWVCSWQSHVPGNKGSRRASYGWEDRTSRKDESEGWIGLRDRGWLEMSGIPRLCRGGAGTGDLPSVPQCRRFKPQLWIAT